MNKLLNSISWTTYLETVAALAIAYYAVIAWKFYRPEIQKLIGRISGRQDNGRYLPEALHYQEEQAPHAAAAENGFPTDQQHSSLQTGNPAQTDLEHELTECIEAAAEKPFAPAILIPRLKKILNDYPDVAALPERDSINALIVRECERTGTALLSESEVDLWWSA